MNKKPPSKKRVVEIFEDTHSNMKKGAKATGKTTKLFASLLFDYAWEKWEKGIISLKDPEINEQSPTASK